jgi:hypothetical protein
MHSFAPQRHQTKITRARTDEINLAILVFALALTRALHRSASTTAQRRTLAVFPNSPSTSPSTWAADPFSKTCARNFHFPVVDPCQHWPTGELQSPCNKRRKFSLRAQTKQRLAIIHRSTIARTFFVVCANLLCADDPLPTGGPKRLSLG